MNREQKRAFIKRARSKGVSQEVAEAYAEIAKNGSGEHTPPQDFLEDDKVKLNIDAIKSRANYNIMSQKYKEFVESNTNTLFSVHVEPRLKNVISLKQAPEWLFWSGDLIKVAETEESK